MRRRPSERQQFSLDEAPAAKHRASSPIIQPARMGRLFCLKEKPFSTAWPAENGFITDSNIGGASTCALFLCDVQ
jgi:hypothetical protein